ncbi:Protein CBG25479 [Caenorhabditis briggsae]|uniref:Protein CBG25479 n=1 Tax=Caenorhabditis briggsae TaxID=6238 RepID=B6IIV4_CAEBR|nr:Protein CBG25479 [Caenorhabditis briggsae]CAR99834.1 Protein CBG25479 [Caenorhabditis briggsae]
MAKKLRKMRKIDLKKLGNWLKLC